MKEYRNKDKDTYDLLYNFLSFILFCFVFYDFLIFIQSMLLIDLR